MHNTKTLLSAAILLGACQAQQFFDPVCTSSLNSLLAAVPTPPPSVLSALSNNPDIGKLDPNSLGDPAGFTEQVCDLVAELPAPVVGDFKSWGVSLLSHASVELSSYDAFITQCVATGEAAASLTSYIHAIATATDALICLQATSGPTEGGETTPTAAAAKPTGLFAGAAAMAGILGAAVLL